MLVVLSALTLAARMPSGDCWLSFHPSKNDRQALTRYSQRFSLEQPNSYMISRISEDMAEKDQNAGSDSEPHERTTMQQEKAINRKKQDKRNAGQQSAHSRSSSRRARRERIEQGRRDGKHMHTTSLEALEEADANGDLQKMGMFERIGPDSTSMDGPVTHARAMRGEIPMRGTDPNQPQMMEPSTMGGGSDLKDQDGLKLTLEANLEIEIELKLSIRGDLTLSL